MKTLSFARLPTVRHRIHVEFDVLDPRTGAGTRSRMPVEIDVPEDRHGATSSDGIYADAGRWRNRLVVYTRIGNVSFAPLYDATLGNCPDSLLTDPDPGRQLARLKFDGRYALPRRFDDVFSSEGRLHAATGRKIENRWSIPTETFEEVERSGREVVDRDRRVAEIRHAASQCFLIRPEAGLCMAAHQPVWGVFERGGQPYVQLHILAPGRRRHDVFGLRRLDDATAFAGGLGRPEPVVSGRVVEMPSEPETRDDPSAVLAGEHAWIARVLRDVVGLLPAEAVAFWHDCAHGAEAVRGYGTAADMLALVDRIGFALQDHPTQAANWGAGVRGLRLRLAFEAGLAAAPADGGPRP
ncbi:hypothetical protein BHAOGJBA_4249 [Methylobacterium hispanicum]|uniref:Uncharacterized protein n=1 Tax=Methylobacterium hispanicum TaxID=270350 RepID=A0AAV4ZR99_9HYPH|nr:hypothetical protein [Methylobacterium hispanicum]GJD90707.1 hypothetical protein BHAOGJBA_4249 [Methylobacterium hispanicum]